MATLDKGAWANCAWTGKALRKCSDATITMKVHRDRHGRVVPAMPRKPFSLKAELEQLFVEIAQGPGAATRHSSCIVNQAHVRTVPLKPKPKHLTNPKHKAALEERCDRLCNMYPVGLIEQNIGSNVGLFRILRAHYEERNQHLPGACTRYTAFNVDTTIFDRILKVIARTFKSNTSIEPHTQSTLHVRPSKLMAILPTHCQPNSALRPPTQRYTSHYSRSP